LSLFTGVAQLASEQVPCIASESAQLASEQVPCTDKIDLYERRDS